MNEQFKKISRYYKNAIKNLSSTQTHRKKDLLTENKKNNSSFFFFPRLQHYNYDDINDEHVTTFHSTGKNA